MIYVASLIAIAIGIGIIHVAWKEYRALDADISALKRNSGLKGRTKVEATISYLGINTDYPISLLSWPQESDYEDSEAYSDALERAHQSYREALMKVEIFGATHIEYRYVAPDGHTYVSRTATRIPDEDNIDLVYALSKVEKTYAYLNPDDFEDSILKETSDEAFRQYERQMQKPQKAKIFVGVAVAIMGAVAPWTFTLLG